MNEKNEVLLEQHEYDISNVQELERELSALQPGSATIDVSNVRYMDTTALRAFMQLGKDFSAKNPGARITLRRAGPSMRRIFEVVGLGQMFEIE